MLNDSELIKSLVSEFPKSATAQVWRLTALSEIPYSGELDYTKRLIEAVIDKQFTGIAFALDGKDQSILPCYNAMIVRALISLHFRHESIERGIEWIMQYQPMDRSEVSNWSGTGVLKYGGCLNKIPCYIGVVKSIKALVEYNLSVKSARIESRINQGIEYILNHQLVYRLQNNDPITKRILDISFPESYHLNVVEILLLLEKTNRLNDYRALKALEYIESKKEKHDLWKISRSYQANGYLSFDPKGQSAEWVSYFLNRISHYRQK